MKIIKKYSATGYVYGACWGGGRCGYEARELKGKTLASIKQQAKKGIADGTLDAGMGFEKITGALLYVKTESVITVNKKEFINVEIDSLKIGKISKELYDL